MTTGVVGSKYHAAVVVTASQFGKIDTDTLCERLEMTGSLLQFV